MRRFVLLLVSAALVAVSCGPKDPLKFRVTPELQKKLPADKLGDADKLKTQVNDTKRAWEIEKKKLDLSQLRFKLAQLYAQAAELNVKVTQESLKLQNEGVPLKLPEGAAETASKENTLAKKNLELRKLQAETAEMRVKHLYMQHHHTRARHFEELVNVLHGSGNAEAPRFVKSSYMKQAADRKALAAAALEQVEKADARIKSLQAELKGKWAPSMTAGAKTEETSPTTPSTPVTPTAPTTPGTTTPSGGDGGKTGGDSGKSGDTTPGTGNK